jgi:hypothetical protein
MRQQPAIKKNEPPQNRRFVVTDQGVCKPLRLRKVIARRSEYVQM